MGREFIHFYRDRSRVATVLLSPVLMWLVIGAGIGKLFNSPLAPGGKGYLEYFFPDVSLVHHIDLSLEQEQIGQLVARTEALGQDGFYF